VLQCVVARCTVCCSVLQCVAVCCSVLQCVAVCCSVLQCIVHVSTQYASYVVGVCMRMFYGGVGCSELQCVAVCCSVLCMCPHRTLAIL